MPQQRVWGEKELRAVALAFRSAHLRGLSGYEAFAAALKVAEYCFPETRDHGKQVAAMLSEANARWGAWVYGEAPCRPEDDKDAPPEEGLE